MNEIENENVTEDAEASTEAQRTEDDVSREAIEEAPKSSRVVRYKADGRLYEEEVPPPDSEEYESWLQDKLSGWRGKRTEKGRNDPGLVEEAIERGVKAGLEYGRPKEPSVEDDPFQLMSQAQRKRYESLREDGTDDDRFNFLVDMGLENRKAHFLVHERNQFLETKLDKITQLQGAAQEMRMISKIDSSVPDPDIDPEGAWQELNKSNGYFDWLEETGIKGSTNRTYRLYLADIGKEAGSRKKKATGEAKPAPIPSSDKTMKKIKDTMGSVSGGGAAIGREADEAEIRQYIKQHGIRETCKEYGESVSLAVFHKARGSDFSR